MDKCNYYKKEGMTCFIVYVPPLKSHGVIMTVSENKTSSVSNQPKHVIPFPQSYISPKYSGCVGFYNPKILMNR